MLTRLIRAELNSVIPPYKLMKCVACCYTFVQALSRPPNESPVTALAQVPNSSYLVTGHDNGILTFQNTDSGACLFLLPLEESYREDAQVFLP